MPHLPVTSTTATWELGEDSIAVTFVPNSRVDQFFVSQFNNLHQGKLYMKNIFGRIFSNCFLVHSSRLFTKRPFCVHVGKLAQKVYLSFWRISFVIEMFIKPCFQNFLSWFRRYRYLLCALFKDIPLVFRRIKENNERTILLSSWTLDKCLTVGLIPSASDPYSLNPDPDPAKNLNSDPDPEDP